MTLRLEAAPDGVRLAVKVVPNASRTCVVGEIDGALKVAVAAPPEKGKANKAVVRLIARVLGLRANRVAVVAGHTTAQKLIHVTGLSAAEVARRISEIIDGRNP